MAEPQCLRPWEIAQLTDRQIMDLYYHPRDDDGRIKRPKPPPRERTPEEWKQIARMVAATFGAKLDADGKRIDE